MSTEVAVALIGTSGLVLAALIGLLVESIKARRGNEKDHKAVLIEISALHETQDKTQAAVKEMGVEQRTQGERLARVEGQLENHLLERMRRR